MTSLTVYLYQVNKPYILFASGEYSVKTGWMIVSFFAILVGEIINSIYIASHVFIFVFEHIINI